MKRKHYIIVMGIIGVMGFLSGLFIGKGKPEEAPGAVTETRETMETFVDTVDYRAPVAAEEVAVGSAVRRFARVRTGEGSGDRGTGFWRQENRRPGELLTASRSGAGDRGMVFSIQENRGTGEPEDSVAVEIPIVQRHYRDSTYEAWVSGYEARLDSVRVFAPTTVITRREWKPPKRWHVGVTAGYGYGPKGVQPYVGIGITYSIISF